MAPHTSMEELFDLDMALTTADEYEFTNEHRSVEDQVVDEMATVVMDGSGKCCIVCQEEFGVGEAAKQVPCAHVFHQNCISKWLSLHNSCPLCRRQLIST